MVQPSVEHDAPLLFGLNYQDVTLQCDKYTVSARVRPHTHTRTHAHTHTKHTHTHNTHNTHTQHTQHTQRNTAAVHWQPTALAEPRRRKQAKAETSTPSLMLCSHLINFFFRKPRWRTPWARLSLTSFSIRFARWPSSITLLLSKVDHVYTVHSLLLLLLLWCSNGS